MKHYIIVKFDESVDANEMVSQIRDLFHKALDINGVDKVEIYVSNIDLPNRHDLMIKMSLSQIALELFDNSEVHKKWKSEYGRYIIQKTIFDCE